MSLSVDTSQLVARFTTSESQEEWSDLEKALTEAFPGKTMTEIHAAATAYMLLNPDATFDELLAGLQTEFAVELSTETAAQIRSEWDEFNQASDLDPSELLAVLDEYGEDSVDTKSQAWLLYLMQYLQKVIEDATASDSVSTQKADRVGYEAAKEEYEKKVAEALESKKASGIFGKIMSWVGAAMACLGALIAVIAATAASIASGGTAAVLAWAGAGIAITLAISAVVGAASDGEYSIAGLVAKGLEACGVPEDVAGYIGIGVEVGLAILGAVCSFGAGLASTSANAAKSGVDVAVKSAETLAKLQKLSKVLNIISSLGQIGVGLASGAQAGVNLWAGLSQAALTEAQALMDQLMAILKSTQKINAQLLEVIFNAIRGTVTEATNDYTDTLNQTAQMDMA
ncbi:hypothetical protein [Desulfocurvus sp. DL9XJH121]